MVVVVVVGGLGLAKVGRLYWFKLPSRDLLGSSYDSGPDEECVSARQVTDN